MTKNKTLDNPIMLISFRSFLGSVSLLTLGILMTPDALHAQGSGASAQSVVGRDDAGQALTSAMARLARSPRDISALIQAGEAALKLDDPRSAMGFFGRADDISPNNGRVKAGLGRSMLALGQTGDGLRLMELAGTLSYSDTALLIDRGLARDLSGNQAGAQRDYQEALQRDPKNELVRRRYAVSLGISGQLDQAEKMIEPLLHQSDRAAWRDRAFILAMNGRTAQALDITGKTMPPALADAIKPYMERMALLTPGQRAAAVHMGQFPAGLVNVRVASTAMPAPQAAATAAASSSKSRKQTRAERAAAAGRGTNASAARVAAVTPTPVTSASAATVPATQTPAASLPSAPLRSAAVAAPTPSQAGSATRGVVAQAPASVAAVAQPATPTRADLRPATTVATTPRTIIETSPATVPSSAPIPQGPPAALASAPSSAIGGAAAPVAAGYPAVPPTPVTPPPAESTKSLAEIMAAIDIPDEERQHRVVPVNLAEIAAMQEEKRRKDALEAKARKAAEAKEAAKRKAEAEAKAKADAEKKRLADNPARYWVQIGVGRDKGALAFTLKRMKKEHDVLGKYDGWSADWGATNRLVVGPFVNLAKAKAVETEMKKAGSDAFVWRSTAGEEVDRIGG